MQNKDVVVCRLLIILDTLVARDVERWRVLICFAMFDSCVVKQEEMCL